MDAGTLEQVMGHIHNWFGKDAMTVRDCEITGGELPASVPLKPLQWYRIDGSTFNDGLHQHPDNGLVDEKFDGKITALAIPNDFLAVVEEICQWKDNYSKAMASAAASPYQSESFNGYSYQLRSDLIAAGSTGWQQTYARALRRWRKLS